MPDAEYCHECDAPLKVGAVTCPACGVAVELEDDQNKGQ